MELNIGEYVIIKPKVGELKGYAQIAQNKQYPLKIYATRNFEIGVYTDGILANDSAQNPFSINTSYLTKLSEVDVKRRIKQIDKEEIGKRKEHLKKIFKKRIALKDRKEYDILQKPCYLNTSGNYLVTYSPGVLEARNFINKDGGETHTAGVVCCSFLKCNGDIIAYIPKSWLNYFGNNLSDLNNYINFFMGCEIGFEGRVLGMRKLKEIYPNLINKTSLNSPSDNVYQDVNEDCYEVFIKGSDTVAAHTYLRFIAFRYIYSSIYSNIPVIAMKMKKNLPKLTNWECLLTANATENYSGYYGFVQNLEGNITIPSAFNSPVKLLKRLKTIGMNISFKRYTGVDTYNLRSAIREENYKQIEEIIKRYRNVN